MVIWGYEYIQNSEFTVLFNLFPFYSVLIILKNSVSVEGLLPTSGQGGLCSRVHLGVAGCSKVETPFDQLNHLLLRLTLVLGHSDFMLPIAIDAIFAAPWPTQFKFF